MNDINSDEIFNQKLDAYSKKLKKPDPYLFLYRKLRVRPLMFWPMWKLMLFTFVFFQVFMSIFLTLAALVIQSSPDRILTFFDLLVSPQLIGAAIVFALVFAPAAKFFFKRFSGLGSWEEL